MRVACGSHVGGLWAPTSWLADGLKVARGWLGVALFGAAHPRLAGRVIFTHGSGAEPRFCPPTLDSRL
jgi:hypothetical protein